MEYLILYLCSISSSVSSVLHAFGGVFLVLGIGVLICNIYAAQEGYSEYSDSYFSRALTEAGFKGSRIITYAIIAIFFGSIIPSSGNCYAIFGVGTTLKYLKDSEEGSKLPDNVIKALNYYLEQTTESEK